MPRCGSNAGSGRRQTLYFDRAAQPQFPASGRALCVYAPELVIPALDSVLNMMLAGFSGLLWVVLVCSSERNWLTAWLNPLPALLLLEAVDELALSLEEPA